MTSTELPPRFKIPTELEKELEYATVQDTRTDEEIIASLSTFVTVASEKNVWAFWDKGVASMPGWSQRNVISWVRLLGPSWTVRVLDSNPDSPNYALRYVPASMMPDSYVRSTMDKRYIGPQSADFVRTAALAVHGGVYLDVGSILIRHLDRMCWDEIMDDSSPFKLCVCSIVKGSAYNFLIAARKGDPFIMRWSVLGSSSTATNH